MSEIRNDKDSKEKQVVNWFLCAVIAFISVVLFTEFFIGAMSYSFGFKTHIHFGLTDCNASTDDQWSSDTVWALYALPSVVLITLSGFIFASMFSKVYTVNIWAWTKFWVMVFAILLGTALMSTSLLRPSIYSPSSPYKAFFQGFACVIYWHRASLFFAFLLAILAGIINILFGFISSPIFFYLLPSAHTSLGKKKNAGRIIMDSFVYVLILILPIAILLSYPAYWKFFLLLFSHALLWLPGLFITSGTALATRVSRNKNKQYMPIYLPLGFALFLIIMTFIFLN